MMILPFYVSAESTGSVNISCSPSTIKSGETTSCTITGKTDNDVSSISMGIKLSENLEAVEFKPNSTWLGDDISNGKIDIYTNSGDPVKSEFTIGTLKIKAKSGVIAKDESLTLTSNVFYHDRAEYKIPDVTASIRIPSNNNSLSSIKVNDDGKFFDEKETSFDLTIKSDTANIVVTTKDSKAKVKGNGQQKLNYGKNTFKIEVTAEDGSKKVYTLNINRPDSRSKENYLLDFGFLNHDIKFDKNKTEYELIVENNISKIGLFASDTKSSIPKTDMFSNALIIDGTKISVSKKAIGAEFVLNDINLFKKIMELGDYYVTVQKAEKKCNDDEKECSYYKDGELVYETIDKDSYNEEFVYMNNELITYYSNSDDSKNDFGIFAFEDLKVGTNSLKYKVTAENGDERVYTFNIIRKDADGKVVDNDIMPPQTGNTIYVIAVIMLVLSFGVGIYFYTKKFKNKI